MYKSYNTIEHLQIIGKNKLNENREIVSLYGSGNRTVRNITRKYVIQRKAEE